MNSIKEIVNGWYNHLASKNQEVAEKRLETCLPCESNTTQGKINITSTCKECGCVLKAKAAGEYSACPKRKW